MISNIRRGKWFAHMSANASDARFDQFGVLPGGFAEVCRALGQTVDARGGRIHFAAKGGRILDVQVRDIDDPDAVARSWPGRGVPVTTPIVNLFDVGDAAGPPGYVATPAAAASALAAVAAIAKCGR